MIAPEKLTPAVAYVRMSTDKQDESPARQRERIEQYAKQNGFNLLQWYFDSGISGAATEKRVEFLRMVERGVAKRDFVAVLVENIDRLSRDDSLKFGRYIGPLADVDILLVSVSERRSYDLNDPNDRTLLTLGADFTRNKYLVDLSDKSTSALMRQAKLGKWTGGAVPYGMDRLLVSPSGQPVRVLDRGEQKPLGDKFRGHYVVLTPGNAAEVEIVQSLFKSYESDGMSLWGLANALNKRGVLAPKGGLWRKESVRNVLANAAYVGDLTFGSTNRGKFHSVSAGGIRTATEVRTSRRASVGLKATQNPFCDPIITRGAFEAIVPRATFDGVQVRLKERGKITTPLRNGGPFLLSGLVHCGHCGGTMHGKHNVFHKGKYRYRQYQCTLYGAAGTGACVRNPVDEVAVVGYLAALITKAITKPENIARIREALMRQLQLDNTEANGIGPKQLDAQIRKADAEIERAADRLMRAPDDLVDVLSPKLQAMRRERHDLIERRKAMQKSAQAGGSGRVALNVEEAMQRLTTIEVRLKDGNPALVREVFRTLVDRIDVWCETVIVGRQKRYKFNRGVVRFKADANAVLTGCVSRS